MSIRAYIVREKNIWVDETSKTYYNNNDRDNLVRYTHEDLEYAFNLWRQPELLSELQKYGLEEYVNDDFVGEIEIGKEDFNSLVENSNQEWSEDDKESIKIIGEYFEEGNDWFVLTTM
ncbi:MAG: hypothetical protein IKF82_02420 [Bacilli bacterium]|nr:hypothetical protein [Bacilli bacterium]